MDIGFRRNGNIIYHTHCPSCTACQATRVDVNAFQMRRDQRRCWKRNQDLSITVTDIIDDDEHRALYQQYEQHIHNNEHAEYNQLNSNAEQQCRAIEARSSDGQLLAVSVIDVFEDAISSVYCYYQPQQQARSLGTFMVLQELHYCQQQHKQWLYLGFYVADCQKLSYKARYRPIQLYRDGQWEWH
jgi:arginine-tRNA-protein transferase